MKTKREVLMKLLDHNQSLLSETEQSAPTAPPELAHDGRTRRYTRIVKNNVSRIHWLLNDFESLWTFGDQQLTGPSGSTSLRHARQK